MRVSGRRVVEAIFKACAVIWLLRALFAFVQWMYFRPLLARDPILAHVERISMVSVLAAVSVAVLLFAFGSRIARAIIPGDDALALPAPEVTAAVMLRVVAVCVIVYALTGAATNAAAWYLDVSSGSVDRLWGLDQRVRPDLLRSIVAFIAGAVMLALSGRIASALCRARA